MHDLTETEYTDLLLEHQNFKHSFELLETRVQACESQQECITSLVRSVDRLTLTVSNMVEEQKEIKKEVKALKEEPVKKFDYYKKTIVSCIITALISAVSGAILSLIITKGGL